MPRLKVDGAEIYYEVYGESGPWLAFVSGLGGLGSFWAAQIEHFSKAYRVVLHDHRGYGKSSIEKAECTVTQAAADIVALIDHLGAAKVNLVGHSMGGMIAQTVALDYPEKVERLVISGSAPALDDFGKLMNAFRGRVLEKLGVDDYCRLLTLLSVGAGAESVSLSEIENNEARVRNGTPQTELVVSRLASIIDFDRLADLPSVTAETLVLASEDDNQCPMRFARAMHAAIPHSQLYILTDGGHFYPRTRPEEFNRVVSEFLASCNNGNQ